MALAITSTGPVTGVVLAGFVTDLVSIVIFAVFIYFRRHRRRDLAAMFTFFNIGLFAVVAVMSRGDFDAGVGFGLFAMLSFIKVRSDPFSPREIGYFFGSLVLAMVNGVGAGSYPLTLALNVVVLVAIFALDHSQVLWTAPRMPRVDITFDRVITDPRELRAALEERLGAHVEEVVVTSIDYVRDMMQLKVRNVGVGGQVRRPVGRIL